MKKSIEPGEARALLLALPVITPETEYAPLAQSRGRVLAEDVIAEIPIPPFDRSPFDGYALRREDTVAATRENPVILRVTEELPAGKAPSIEIRPGFAAKILTGAPIPPGADCTVKYEWTEFDPEQVKIFQPLGQDSNIVRAGSDVPRGACAAPCGELLSPPVLGLLASLGRSQAKLYRRPTAALLQTGSELVEPGKALLPAKVYNSSAFVLRGALEDMGFETSDAGVVRDEADAISRAMKKCLEDCDVLVSTGGASVGDYDFLLPAMRRLGAEILFRKIKLKPGGALAVSRVGEKLILGLSGNPGSALMGLMHIARPWLLRRTGRRRVAYEPVDVFLKHDAPKTGSRTRVLRGRLEIENGQAYFSEQGRQDGGLLSAFRDCDLLAEIPANSGIQPAGTLVRAYRI
jgi:molybdopterin molybdotransferase